MRLRAACLLLALALTAWAMGLRLDVDEWHRAARWWLRGGRNDPNVVTPTSTERQ